MMEEREQEGVEARAAIPPHHARAFDHATEDALRRLERGESGETRSVEVTYRAVIRWKGNPGWVLDRYIVDLQ